MKSKLFQSATIGVAGLMALFGIAMDVAEALNVADIKVILEQLYGPRSMVVWAVIVVVARLRTLWKQP